MNSFERELLTDKLNDNVKRQNYLKVLSIISLCIDLTAYVMLESIDLAFDKFTQNYWLLVCYLSKIIIFLLVAGFILVSMAYHKRRVLLVSALVYLILGLMLFSFLIIQEMQAKTEGSEMKNLTSSKPEIYYTVFIKIIICLNIIAGVFRLLGSIFIFIYLRISNKIVKITGQLNENLIAKEENSNYNFLSKKNRTGINSVLSTQSNFYPSSRCSTFIESARGTGEKTSNNVNKNKTNSEETNSNRNYLPDVNIYINNNGETKNLDVNNIHVHVYNYNLNMASHKYKIPPISSNTYESDHRDDREEHLESMYETPKRGSFVMQNNNFDN